MPIKIDNMKRKRERKRKYFSIDDLKTRECFWNKNMKNGYSIHRLIACVGSNWDSI